MLEIVCVVILGVVFLLFKHSKKEEWREQQTWLSLGQFVKLGDTLSPIMRKQLYGTLIYFSFVEANRMSKSRQLDFSYFRKSGWHMVVFVEVLLENHMGKYADPEKPEESLATLAKLYPSRQFIAILLNFCIEAEGIHGLYNLAIASGYIANKRGLI